MKLASHIDFKPAETIEEAKKFGKKFLGIKKYKNIDDLDILNWINGGLVELNNKTKGTSKMPTKITGKDINGAQAAAGNMINGGNILYINQNIIKKMINQLSTNMDILLSTEALTRKRNDGTYQLSRLLTKDGFTKKFEDLINKYKKNPNNLSFKEKILLSQSTGEIMSYVNEMFVNGSQIKQIARMNLDFPINGKKWTLEEIKKLGKDEQIKVLSELIGLNKDFKIPYSSNPYSTIFHELGHINHLKSAGRKLYVQYSTLEELKGFSTKTKEISKEFNDSLEKQAIVRDISIYSGESPAEFVAETYSRLITGDKIPDRVMKLYNSYKGPKVEI